MDIYWQIHRLLLHKWTLHNMGMCCIKIWSEVLSTKNQNLVLLPWKRHVFICKQSSAFSFALFLSSPGRATHTKTSSILVLTGNWLLDGSFLQYQSFDKRMISLSKPKKITTLPYASLANSAHIDWHLVFSLWPFTPPTIKPQIFIVLNSLRCPFGC